jgi:hypothetical protein
MKKLKTEELEQRIKKFKERGETLTAVINDISDPNAVSSLQKQIGHYRNLLNELSKELASRKQTKASH